MNRIYDGHVTGVKDFGAFVNLHGIGGNLSGLVHFSPLADGLTHPSDLVRRGQPVKVKIISRDLAPGVNFGSSANAAPLGRRGNRYTNADLQTPSSATK
ncbi:hypothetical protein B0I37DRAFT_419416 [Chaetomium sp. MPI-CAGE-AT-0009]|nr:hypothetical protein B0I37DRAFT_419416 [Chaetomium sp. MPI-CAGE-AT-0009]